MLFQKPWYLFSIVLMSWWNRSPCSSDTVPSFSRKKPDGNPGNELSVTCNTPLLSNISKDSWCYPCSPLPSCCPRLSDRPCRKHSRWAVPAHLMLAWSWHLWVPLWFGVWQIYPKPLEFFPASVLINCFISLSFIYKVGNGAFPGSASGILLKLHSPGCYVVLGGQFGSACLSAAQPS